MKMKDSFSKPKDAFKFGMATTYAENFPLFNGEIFYELTQDGKLLDEGHVKNIPTYDSGILIARLLKNNTEPNHGINMLAVGSGATGALLSPDAADPRQRKLNAEIDRKPFYSTTFRDAGGNAVAYPTNIVDYSVTFGEAEAVGVITEMGLLSTVSDNRALTANNPNTFPVRDVTLDISSLDILTTYITMLPISKPSGAVLSVTYRVTT